MKKDPLFIKLRFGVGYIITKEILSIDDPDNGICGMDVVPVAGGLWTGEACIYTYGKVSINFINVVAIETRRSLCPICDDKEPWETIWTKKKEFYEDFHHAAKILRKLIGEEK